MTAACSDDASTVADTVPTTVADTVPTTVADTVPTTVADTVPTTVADIDPAAVGDTVAPPSTESAAFCDAMITAQQGANSLYTDRSAGNLANIQAFLDQAAATAPDDLPATFTAGAVIRRALEGDFTGVRSEEFLAAQAQIRTYLVESCPTDESFHFNAIEYTFENVPTTVTGRRVRFDLQNNGTEPHEMTLLRLADGETRTPRQIWDDPADPNYRHINRAQADPGDSVSMIVDLEAGQYAFVCLIPTDASGQGVHLSKGMFSQFAVE